MYYVDVQAVLDAANSKIERGEREVTRARLARKLRTSKQTLTNYQSGRVPVVISQLAYLSEVSGLTMDEIIKKRK